MIEQPNAHPLTAHLDFKEHHVYKLAYTMDDPKLRGRKIVFLGWEKHHGDVQRAKVGLLNTDGSTGDKLLVLPSLVIPL